MLNKRLASLRKKSGLTQYETAEKLGISRGKLANYEQGSRQPDYDMLKQLSDFYNVTTDYLLGKSDNPNMTEDESFEAFIKDPNLRRWFKKLPESDEEDIARLKKIWEAFKDD